MSDAIADMLTIIRNGLRAGHKQVAIKYSRLKYDILYILKEEGYIEDFLIQEHNQPKEILVDLRYYEGKPAIERIDRVSKQSRRFYSSYKDIPTHYNGLGSVIITTSKGVMTGHRAREMRVGGEILCAVF